MTQETLRKSQIRDINLADRGHKKLNWVKNRMPVLNQVLEVFKNEQTFKGKRITICLHLEAKTGYLAQVLKEAGAEVTVVASNPLSTQDDVVAALVESGITAFAWYGATAEEYHNHLKLALETAPNLVIDDGGDLVSLLHNEYKHLLPGILGGCEETTTGLVRLRSMAKENELKIPMIAVNDAYMKYLFDNRYGTGQSVWDAIMRTTNLVVAGKTVVVVGYGWCGKGVALRAKGLGAKVIVCEIDHVKANEAMLDGFEVMTMLEAAQEGDFFITVTGNKNVIRKEHFIEMKDGALLANAGHFDIEISKPDLYEMAGESKIVRPNVEEFTFADQRRVYLLAEGRLVNLAAGDGHPAEIMDMSFAVQALSLRFLLLEGSKLAPQVYVVPEDIDQDVARMRLKALNVRIDVLTQEQIDYLNSWQVD